MTINIFKKKVNDGELQKRLGIHKSSQMETLTLKNTD